MSSIDYLRGNKKITPRGKTEVCPNCKSHNTRKNGFRIYVSKKVQRLECKDCKKGFSKPKEDK